VIFQIPKKKVIDGQEVYIIERPIDRPYQNEFDDFNAHYLY